MKGAIQILRATLALILIATAASALAEPALRVIDGDTVAVGETVYRLVGFDAPETGDRAQCQAEADLGRRATLRMRALVFAGEIDLEPVACSCRPDTEGTRACNYGRRCAVLRSKGEDVAKIMIREGLARPYVCGATRCPARQPWC